ncbi:hypothetical protein MES4922_230199 [Mesorhizobium ventifaucium]|uniref:SDR family NAD(P)-dependent oxidoreductase n=1 Tax=Mesorhizobium ventifaucium TaxID=666020 RepID=A0ABM9DU45_9HYPH|nr:hypothetical protein MES4922_230199 [Mesorhizobium ventifaucium]
MHRRFRSPEKIFDPAPMISDRLRCPCQWAWLDGPAARTARWSMRLLQGQNVVVVGGSRGVGRSIAEAALSEGATVLAVARSEQTLAAFARETSSVKAFAVDATVDTAPNQVFAALEPDVLVICAGALAPSAPLHEQNWAAFSANWETDVKSSFLFCKAALRRPLKPGARIVLISSGAALTGGHRIPAAMPAQNACRCSWPVIARRTRIGAVSTCASWRLRLCASCQGPAWATPASRAFRPIWASGPWSSSRASSTCRRRPTSDGRWWHSPPKNRKGVPLR